MDQIYCGAPSGYLEAWLLENSLAGFLKLLRIETWRKVVHQGPLANLLSEIDPQENSTSVNVNITTASSFFQHREALDYLDLFHRLDYDLTAYLNSNKPKSAFKSRQRRIRHLLYLVRSGVYFLLFIDWFP